MKYISLFIGFLSIFISGILFSEAPASAGCDGGWAKCMKEKSFLFCKDECRSKDDYDHNQCWNYCDLGFDSCEGHCGGGSRCHAECMKAKKSDAFCQGRCTNAPQSNFGNVTGDDNTQKTSSEIGVKVVPAKEDKKHKSGVTDVGVDVSDPQ